MFRNVWIRSACFLTGYNYSILRNSTESSVRVVLKYQSAILMICILWGFIGYNFVARYIEEADFLVSMTVAIVLIIIAIQIERQIIMSTGKKKIALVFRILIGLLMAFIGSLIIDQILFAKDIDIEKTNYIKAQVEERLPDRIETLQKEIYRLDTQITYNQNQLIYFSNLEPLLNTSKTKTTVTTTPRIGIIDSTILDTVDSIITSNETILSQLENPKFKFIPELRQSINDLTSKRIELVKQINGVEQELENKLKEETGFLDDLNILMSLLSKDGNTHLIIVWGMFFLFFFLIEMFVLTNKISDNKSAYDEILNHQERIYLARLELLQKQIDK